MAVDWIIVDGYNMIYKHADLARLMERDIGLARLELTRLLERAIPRLARRVTVVFDGRGKLGGRSEFESTTVEVVFSPAHCSADTLIESTVGSNSDPSRIMVVTSDNLVSNAVAGAGAETASCAAFLDQLSRTAGGAKPIRSHSAVRAKFGRIGDHFPD